MRTSRISVHMYRYPILSELAPDLAPHVFQISEAKVTETVHERHPVRQDLPILAEQFVISN